MSMEFVALLAGPDRQLHACIPSVDRALSLSGRRLGASVANARLDLSRQVFDETDVELHGVQSLAQIQRSLALWNGAALEYRHTEIGTLYVLFGRTVDEFLNIWIEIGERSFRRSFTSAGRKVLYQAIGAIATACNADAGVGDLEQSREPCAPQDLLSLVSRDAQREAQPVSKLYLLQESQPNADAIAAWSRRDALVS